MYKSYFYKKRWRLFWQSVVVHEMDGMTTSNGWILGKNNILIRVKT